MNDKPTRINMIETTARLIERQGFAATGLNQILKESKAPRGSLYYHFPDGKEELVTEAILHRAQRISQHVAQQLAQHQDVLKAFDRLIDSMIAYANETDCSGGAPIAAVALETSTTNPVIREACCKAYELLQTPIEQKLLNGGFSAQMANSLATHITAVLEGAIVLTRVQKKTTPLSATRQQIRHLLTCLQTKT
ncbi:MAG: TetR/AcrR family transcriptional regulator [Chloroflexota bacterium]